MILNIYRATNLQQLREAIANLEQFAFVASGRGLHTDEINLECHSNAGVELVLSERKLTDGSKVYDVTFKDLDTRVPQAIHADAMIAERSKP